MVENKGRKYIKSACSNNSLGANVHIVCTKKLKELEREASAISNSKNLINKRTYFIRLSDKVYSLAKIGKQDELIYYQHCPTANHGKGENWLSQECIVKNPYYCSQMFNCGNTVDAIN